MPDRDKSEAGKRPRDDLRLTVEHAECAEDENRLGSLDDAGHEAQRALVGRLRVASLEQRGQSEPDPGIHVERAQQNGAREPRFGYCDSNGNDERSVEDEICNEVDKPSRGRAAAAAGKHTVDSVQIPVHGEEPETEPPLLERDSHTGAEANREPRDRNLGGRDADLREWARAHVERRAQPRSRLGVDHRRSISRPRAVE